MVRFSNQTILLILLFFSFSCVIEIKAQNAKEQIEKIKLLIDEEKYDEGYKLLLNVKDETVDECGDLYIMLYNYEKGTCLYYLEKYEEAIPCLQKGLKAFEKLPNKDCNYLEMMYGIGTCYKKIGNLSKAEEFYRRTIIKGNYLDINCAIKSKTYGELAELYTLMAKPKLAEICTSRIASDISFDNSNDLDSQLEDLYILYKAYENQGKVNDAIITLRKMLRLITEKKGKVNEDYLFVSNLLGYQLRYGSNQPDAAASIFKEIIDVGGNKREYKEEVGDAYEQYLRYLAENGKIDSVELLLPSAIKYLSSPNSDSRSEKNLYETIGLGLCDAKLYEEGVKYLERKWNGKIANSIKALDCLGQFYFRSDPDKAISFYKNAESQINNGLNVDDNTKQVIFQCLMILNESIGNFNEAIKYAELAEPFFIKTNDNNSYLRHLSAWSADCVNAGKKEKAIGLLNKLDTFIDKADDETIIPTLSNMGFVYLKSDMLDKAIDTLHQGVDLAIKVKGNKCPELKTLYHNLGRAYMLKHDYSHALSALIKSKDLQLELDGKVMQRTTDYIKECQEK